MKPSNAEMLERDTYHEPNSGCWLWGGNLTPDGYANFYSFVEHRTLYAHRESYKERNGPIPPGMQIDHLCRVRCCINPDHLEAVTPRENTLRGNSTKQKSRTECDTCGEALVANRDGKAKSLPKMRCRSCRNRKDRADRLRLKGVAIEALAALGDPDAIRMTGGRDV